MILHTSSEVGADGLAGERPAGGIHRNCVGGTGQQVGQLVLLVVSIHENCFSFNCKQKRSELEQTFKVVLQNVSLDMTS